MSKDIELIINSKIDVMYKSKAYRSKIQDVTSEYVSISIPVNSGEYLPLNTNEKVEVIYYTSNEAYKFTTEVIGRKLEKIYVFLLKLPKVFEKVQRRNYVRMTVIIDVAFARINANKNIINMDQSEITFNKGLVIDISGGGLRIVTSEPLQLGETVLMNLTLRDDDLSLKGTVVRKELNFDKKFVCGINFVEQSAENTEKIIRYVFELMREQRKKDLI